MLVFFKKKNMKKNRIWNFVLNDSNFISFLCYLLYMKFDVGKNPLNETIQQNL